LEGGGSTPPFAVRPTPQVSTRPLRTQPRVYSSVLLCATCAICELRALCVILSFVSVSFNAGHHHDNTCRRRSRRSQPIRNLPPSSVKIVITVASYHRPRDGPKQSLRRYIRLVAINPSAFSHCQYSPQTLIHFHGPSAQKSTCRLQRLLR